MEEELPITEINWLLISQAIPAYIKLLPQGPRAVLTW